MATTTTRLVAAATTAGAAARSSSLSSHSCYRSLILSSSRPTTRLDAPPLLLRSSSSSSPSSRRFSSSPSLVSVRRLRRCAPSSLWNSLSPSLSSSSRYCSSPPVTPRRMSSSSIAVRYLSSAPKLAGDDGHEEEEGKEAEEKFLEWPSNLKIDRKSTSSPFFGMKRVERQEEEEDLEAETSEEYVEEEEEDDEDEEEEEEEEKKLYDISTARKPYRAIPLPQRLHVPVLHLPTSEEAGTIHLDASIFGCNPIRPDVIHNVIVYGRNKKRGKRYPAKTKTVSEVSGSGRKVRNQKGGGVARAGHSRPAHWRGGAKAHGPKGVAQDYTTKLNKKVRRMGMRHALSQKLLEGNLLVTTDLRMDTHKTGALAKVLYKRQDIGGKYGVSALFVDDAKDEPDEDGTPVAEEDMMSIGGVDINFKVASGNIPRVKLVNQLGATVYDIIKYEKLVLSLAAVTALEGRLQP